MAIRQEIRDMRLQHVLDRGGLMGRLGLIGQLIEYSKRYRYRFALGLEQKQLQLLATAPFSRVQIVLDPLAEEAGVRSVEIVADPPGNDLGIEARQDFRAASSCV